MSENELTTYVFHTFRVFNDYRSKLIAGRFSKNATWALPSVIHNDPRSAYSRLLSFLQTNILGDNIPIVSIVNVGEYMVEAIDPSVGKANFKTLLYDVKYFGTVVPKLFGDFDIVRWMRPDHLFVQHQLNRPTSAAKILMESENA